MSRIFVNFVNMERSVFKFWLILGLSLASLSQSGCAQPTQVQPPDSQLEEIFSNNRKDFDLLVEMAETDAHVVRIDHDFTWLENDASWPRLESEIGFATHRWDEYRSLFKKLNLQRGLQRYPETGQIFLIASSKGLLTGGSNKGYVFSTETPGILRDSLDGDVREDLGKKPIFKRLEGNWYLYFRN